MQRHAQQVLSTRQGRSNDQTAYGLHNPYECQELVNLIRYAEDTLKYCQDLLVRFQRIMRGTIRLNTQESEERSNVNHDYRQKDTWRAHRILRLAKRASELAADMASFD